ncbi:hypothetical protein PR002_g17155 [Phytophthora rubi]|uniref:Uncharacterized protein n=1 Tax=Phytophthora rubi TaxID=129364 RepID=A0A6A3KED4_9STRA|nr:hypothetical protein PR002_g17155 [Phytophthora rubi]
MAKSSLASHTTWKGFESSGIIKIGADAKLFFTEPNAAWGAGRHNDVASFFSKDDRGWINPA